MKCLISAISPGKPELGGELTDKPGNPGNGGRPQGKGGNNMDEAVSAPGIKPKNITSC